ncbi:MAG: primosomal protein N' [Candidatus Hydrogenedens sp.]|nr:primosomal protein N' [Candidatus Hydrogenedens sp.]
MTPHFAEIVLPLPLDRAFTYAVPESLRDRARPGMRAVVPVMNRFETGFIVKVTETSAVEKVKPILDLPDELPAFSEPMLKLCRWMADYYCCSWGEALQCAVPAGMRVGTKLRYTLVEEAMHQGRFTDRQKAVVAALYSRGPLLESQIGAVAGKQALSNTLQALVRRGVLLAEPIMKEATANVRTETYVRVVDGAVPDNETLAALQRRAPKQAAVYLDLLHGAGSAAATALYEKHQVNSATLRALEERGYIERFEEEFYRSPDIQASGADKHALNDEQQAAYGAIADKLEAGEFQTFLLHGITGSGKTEVYLQVIERALALGKDAIILVPEISLTPQTVGRFFSRFKENIAVLHSALSVGERYDEWRRAQRGEVRIVVGARSAVFAPLRNLGVIVVDEEHDTSYKQGETPRYHARDVAIMRAHLSKGVCVLGSATPSIEAFYNSERGKSVRLSLSRRATSGVLPSVKVVDMRIEARELGGKVVLSRTLEAEVLERVKRREQVILLLNRRGFAPYVMCPQCGWCAECEHCNVSLTFHKRDHSMQCHYCGHTEDAPLVCGKCHFNPLVYLGTGTQRGEEYLMAAFPGARVERMDADTTAGRGGHAKILGRFAQGEIDILIGTQMLAKGHDYPGVTLVGVINADTGLTLPDFRAAEQAFNLLTQVAGRAGRGDRAGEVVIQTFRPKHYAVQAAAEHDYARFYAEEIAHREANGYPPFRRMANFLLEAEDPQLAEQWIMRLKGILRERVETPEYRGVEIIGPSPAAVRKVKRQYRWNLGLLSNSSARINALTRAARDAFQAEKPPTKLKLKVDLDPYGMY